MVNITPPISLSPPAPDKDNIPESTKVATCGIGGISSNSEKESMKTKGRDTQPIGVQCILKEEKGRHQDQIGRADLKKI